MDKFENVDEIIKKNKNNIFYIMSIIIISLILLYLIINVLFYNEEINEGNYRVVDASVVSTTEFINISTEEKWAYSISNLDTLSILIEATDVTKITTVYIKDFNVDKPYNIKLSQKDHTTMIEPNTDEILQLGTTTVQDNTIMYELQFKNRDILDEYVIPSEMDSITLDGTIYNLAGIGIYDLMYTASFDLIIEDIWGTKSIMRVQIAMPNSELITEGAYIAKLDTSKFVFKILSWRNFFRYM